FGEVSLSGEVRPVAHAAQRLKDAEKLGFNRAIMPANVRGAESAITRAEVRQIHDLVTLIAGTQ
ncbi:MAG: DNA repair protein RadA, partial [Sphingomonadales bacterium]